MDQTQSLPLRREKARKILDKHHRETWDRPFPSRGHRTTCDDDRESEIDKPVDTQGDTYCAGRQERTGTQVDRWVGRESESS